AVSEDASAKPFLPARRGRGSYGIIHRLHSVAGVFVAPLLVVSALSGFIYAFAPPLEHVVYRAEITASSTQGAQSPREQVNAARSAHPSRNCSAVQSSDVPGQTARVLFDDPELDSPSYPPAVFVDPGSLEVTGTLVQYGASRALPLRTWISQGHRYLRLGE